jgi:hypothetical protein
VELELAELVPGGWAEWLLWLEVCLEIGADTDVTEAQMLREDAGRNLGFNPALLPERCDSPTGPSRL